MSTAMLSNRTCVGASTSTLRCRAPQAGKSAVRPALPGRRLTTVRAAGNDTDSYQKIEAPVRTNNVGPQVGPDVKDRQSEADNFLKSDTMNPDRSVLGTEVGVTDAMRFKGAAPEVINSRLAMLGFVAAVAAEKVSGQNILEQINTAPISIAFTFVLFTVASLVPIIRGVPRNGNGIWTPDAELVNGRLAMIGIVALFLNAFVTGHSI